MIIHDCEQGSDEWFRARLGIPTASMFATVMAKGEGKTRGAYMRKLAGEIITGEPAESFSNVHTDRGNDMEARARKEYAFQRDAVPELVGFITNDDRTAGASPDSLIGDRKMLELKTALPHILIEKIVANKFPAEHVAQCQGNLWIAERDEIDIGVYWPAMPLFIKTARRDEAYIAKLADEVERFNDELAVLVDRVRRYGAPPADLKVVLTESLEMAE